MSWGNDDVAGGSRDDPGAENGGSSVKNETDSIVGGSPEKESGAPSDLSQAKLDVCGDIRTETDAPRIDDGSIKNDDVGTFVKNESKECKVERSKAEANDGCIGDDSANDEGGGGIPSEEDNKAIGRAVGNPGDEAQKQDAYDKINIESAAVECEEDECAEVVYDIIAGYDIRNQEEQLKEFTEEDVVAWRNTWHMFVESSDKTTPIPKPVRTFAESKLPGDILDLIDYRRGGDFENPTPIQSQGWPIIMTGKNVIGVAQTGSGKTLAFVLPAVVHIRKTSEDRPNCPTVMVQAPTRELARQIGDEAERYGGGVKVGHAFGGPDKRGQKPGLKTAQMVVGTPGRTIEQISHRSINLKYCTYIVLDEADRMLDMGFQKQVQKMFRGIKLEDRQLILFTATWQQNVHSLAEKLFKNNWLKVTIGALETSANHNIIQRFTFVNGNSEKQDRLVELLNSKEFKGKKTIIFCKSIASCNQLWQFLQNKDFITAALNSGKDQAMRDLIVRDFKKGEKLRCIIATDVAQRGLHVQDIFLVVNFDFPNNMEEYVHRIGRTARQGRWGLSMTMIDMKIDSRHIGDLVKVLKEAKQPMPKEFKAWDNNHLNSGCKEGDCVNGYPGGGGQPASGKIQAM